MYLCANANVNKYAQTRSLCGDEFHNVKYIHHNFVMIYIKNQRSFTHGTIRGVTRLWLLQDTPRQTCGSALGNNHFHLVSGCFFVNDINVIKLTCVKITTKVCMMSVSIDLDHV